MLKIKTVTISAALLILSNPVGAVNIPEPTEWDFAEDNLTPLSEVYQRDNPTEDWKKMPLGMDTIVKDQAALVRLGKALFWDVNVGGDDNACASCHFQAGTDNRIDNAVNPGSNHRRARNSKTFQARPSGWAGAGEILTVDDFPLTQFDESRPRAFVDVLVPHLVLPPGFIEGVGDMTPPFGVVATRGQRPNPRRVRVIDDVYGSQGSFGGTRNLSSPGGDTWCDRAALDGPFVGPGVNGSMLHVRKVEPRQTPTVIGSHRNKKNFWDGRAKNIFNGVNPDGLADQNAYISWYNGFEVTQKQIAATWHSAASQAVGPAVSPVEMTCGGTTFADIGAKLLDQVALKNQRVDPTDSVLGLAVQSLNHVTDPLDPLDPAPAPDPDPLAPKGLSQTYRQMIQSAFHETVAYSPAGLDQDNFALIFGLAVEAYEATLKPNQAPFDLTARDKGFLARVVSDPVDVLSLPLFTPGFELLEGQCYIAQTVNDVNGQLVTLSGNCLDTPNEEVVSIPDGVVVSLLDVDLPGKIEDWTDLETQGIDLFMGNFSKYNLPTAVIGEPMPGVDQPDCLPPNTWDRVSTSCLNTTVQVYDQARNICTEQVNAVPAKNAGCVLCHMNAEFTSAAVSALKTPLPIALPAGAVCPPPPIVPVALDTMPLLSGLIVGSPIINDPRNLPEVTPARRLKFMIYDVGFYDVGVTPDAYDIGLGANGTHGEPLSWSKQLHNALKAQRTRPFRGRRGNVPKLLAEAELVDFIGGFDPVDDDFLGKFADPLLGCGDPPKLIASRNVPLTLCELFWRTVRPGVMSTFKTTSLRNVGLTAPYFHNGGSLSLKQVVHHYNLGCMFWMNKDIHPECIPRLLTDVEENAIAAFLGNKLTDPRVSIRAAPFDGPELDVLDGYQRLNGFLVQNPSTTSNVQSALVETGNLLANDLHTIIPATGAAGGSPLPTFTERLDSTVNANGVPW